MKRLFLLVLAISALSSCATTYYQIFSIKPENAVYTSNGSPVYVQDGLEFTYNFWGEYGNVRFVIYNSNDYDVVVDMKKSSFIRNSIAEDYYQGKQFETRVATGVYQSSKYGVTAAVHKQASAGALVNYLGKTYDVALAVGSSVAANSVSGTAVKKEWETAVVQKEPETVRIPAKSAKAFCSFNVNEMRVSSRRLAASDYYQPITFTKETTPMEFRNRICVSKDSGEENCYDMNFYISEIGNTTGLFYGLIKPTSFYISYSSELEGTDTNEALFTQPQSNLSESGPEPPQVPVSKAKSSTGYTRETAIARLDEIIAALSSGNTAELELYKIDVQGITKWYNQFSAVYMEVERGLREARKLIKQYE